jgi:hypothetical protein
MLTLQNICNNSTTYLFTVTCVLIYTCLLCCTVQVYYLGVQTAVPKRENGQCAANPGWVYAMGLHA